MSEMRYLFVRVSWVNCHILTISILVTTEELKELHKICKMIRPVEVDRIHPNTFKQMKIQKAHLELAKSEEAVLNNIFTSLSGDCYKYSLIVWDDVQYDILMDSMAKNHVEFTFDRTLFLSDAIYRKTAYSHGLKSACNYYGIEINASLWGFSKYEVSLMKQVFDVCDKKYQLGKYFNTYNYGSLNGGFKYHSLTCRYMKGKAVSQRYVTIKAAEKKGLTPCKYCKCTVKNPPKQIETDDEFMLALCKQYKLDCQVKRGVIFINSPVFGWAITKKNNKYTLYHQNRRGNFENTFLHGFHKQLEDKLENIVLYIYNHDKKILEF